MGRQDFPGEGIVGIGIEDERSFKDIVPVLFQQGLEGDGDGFLLGIAEDAGGDEGKGDGFQIQPSGKADGIFVAEGEKSALVVVSVDEDRTGGVDDEWSFP